MRRTALWIYAVHNAGASASSLEITVPRDLADGFVNNKRETYRFRFLETFDQDTKQEAIFERIARPVAERVLAGYNGTVFAYGQTGSGKTFTITGGAERYSDRGIIPRTLSYIFQEVQKDVSKVYTVHVSYLEIYNECGYDLLDPRHEASKLEDLPKVTIMEDPDQNIHLKNLSLQPATSEEEALNLLFLGDTNRMIAETPMNQASTRSHCIFTIHISSKEPGSATVRRSKLHLVDLAGSERVAKTGVGGQLLTEAKYINLSLHYLEQVIIALAEKNRSHIPYRNSMMTSVLRDSLGGNCMTTMIATLSMEKRNIDESISTCRFAQRVALIKNEAVLNEEVDPQLMIGRLKKEVQALKDEIALLSGEQRTAELTPEETQRLQEQLRNFLEDSDPEQLLDVGADMRKIHYCFTYFKRLLHDQAEMRESVRDPERPPSAPPGEMKKLRDLLQQRDSEINILVSMLKKEKKRNQDMKYHNPQHPTERDPHSSTPPTATRTSALHRKTEEMSLGRQEAFEIFKRDYPGRVHIEDNKVLLKQRFAEAKSLGEEVNNVRRRINELKAAVEQRRMQQAARGVSSIIQEANECDPEEEELRAQMEAEKKRYKERFTRLKSLKTEIEHLQLLLEKSKIRLQKEFQEWWTQETCSLQIIMEAWEKGLNPKGNATNPSNWDFSNSFFFAGTVITTIGYGNLYPSTMGGQVFCVFYALFGIPLNVAFLNQIGKGLNAHLLALGRCSQEPEGSGVMKVMIMGLFLTTGSLLFLVFPPMIFSYVEGWSYGEGFYFAFITLSTIGFGDYVLGTDPNKHYISIYRSLAALWIIFGLAWLAMVFNLVAEMVEKLVQLRMHKAHVMREEAAVKTEERRVRI
ncbi:kinesin-like protein KIF6 isoform X2 [Engystomops pustulosus]|uniref:kinesin-like protein KIF6 isoform X2 n=1 Tax=Engystomops pustulosus TaxID=76066 RepID=UPI003AFA5E39